MAARWITALVDPPTANNTRVAFSSASAVSTRLGLRSDPTSEAAILPLASATRSRSASTAGTAAAPVGIMPRASEIEAIVLAVPITAQVPAVVARRPSTPSICSSETSPAR